MNLSISLHYLTIYLYLYIHIWRRGDLDFAAGGVVLVELDVHAVEREPRARPLLLLYLYRGTLYERGTHLQEYLV